MEQYPIRKKIRLPEYDYSQNGGYFVTICTKNRQCLLGRIVGGDTLIPPYAELSNYGLIVEKHLRSIPGINKYCIMPNHIHMIIMIQNSGNGPMWASAPTQSLSQRIRSFKTVVTKEIGTPLFQRSYYDHIIRGDADYRRIWTYIDENPIKWQSDCYYVP